MRNCDWTCDWTLSIAGVCLLTLEPSGAWVERIDEHHANAKRRWQAFGAPEYLAGAALEQLHEASRLTRQACSWNWLDDRIAFEIELPPYAVASLRVEFAPA